VACCATTVLVGGCSDSPTGATAIATLTVSPAPGPPVTPIRLSGLDESQLNGVELEARIGGRVAPIVLSESGQLLTAVPLCLNEAVRPAPPAEPQDVSVLLDGQTIGQGKVAITVEALPVAVNTLSDAADALAEIAALRSREEVRGHGY